MESEITSGVIPFIHPEVEEKILRKFSKEKNSERTDNLAKKIKTSSKKKESVEIKRPFLSEQHRAEVPVKLKEEVSKPEKKEMDIWLL